MNCKACNEPFEQEILSQVFCSEYCAKTFEKTMMKVRTIAKAKPISANMNIHFGVIKKNVNKFGLFRISNKTLEEYLSLKAFDDFVLENRFLVVRQDNEFSEIKKSVLG